MSTSSISLPRRRARSITIPALRPELAALLVLAGVLYLWALDRNGFANEYYSAAVRSMSSSWHAFLYGSFDPAGVMTVDKPPLALWVQALSARVFGFSSWSLLAPQALMGVATVALAYDLTRRRFGRAAGFTAGLVLALTPITVAIARHNNPDALLVLCCTAALWFVVRGLEDGRTRWIVPAGVSVGLGFEAKMAAALLVVPAIVAAWLWMAPRRGAAVRQLLAAGAAMTGAGLAWPVLMWLTPASDRPWISGTSDNSIWSLIFGYNGLGRLLGQEGGPGGGGAGPGGRGPFGGDPGVLRLLNDSLGGQGGWLLGLAIAGALGLLIITRLRRSDPRTGWLLLVGGTFATTAVAFSGAEGIFHPYYASQLAPGVWSAQTLGHATSGTFPAGGPATAGGFGGGPMAAGGPAGGAGRFAAPPAGAGGWNPFGGGTTGGGTTGGGQSGSGGGPFGGDSGALAEAVAYAQSHGGGTIAVSSQTGAAQELISSGADVAGIGGFSGRESQVSTDWLADAVASGRIRYVLADGTGGLPNDGRTGASDVMAAVEAVGKPVSGVDGLYDLQGLADALRSA